MKNSHLDKVRKIYERHPYPNVPAEWKSDRWTLASMDWIKVVWKREQNPGRILVAGCGTGAEAFLLSRRFPNAEIVAVDFSPRSIRMARDSQKRARKKTRISFLVADLQGPQFRHLVG